MGTALGLVLFCEPFLGEDAIGAMIVQKDNKYHYVSGVNTVTERGFSEVELLLVSVVYGCTRFRHYTDSFIFLTSSYSVLPQLVNGASISKELMKWIIKL